LGREIHGKPHVAIASCGGVVVEADRAIETTALVREDGEWGHEALGKK